MYRRAARVFRRNFLFFALMAVTPVVVSAFVQSVSTNLIAKLMFYSVIMLFCHRFVLSGAAVPFKDTFRIKPDGPLGGSRKPFLLILSAFWILKGSIWIICGVAMSFLLMTIDPAFQPDDVKSMLAVMIGAVLPTALIVYVMLSLVGTLLPAAAALQDISLGWVLVTGRAVLWRTYGNLFLGNGLFTLGSLLLAVIIHFEFGENEEVALGYLFYFCWELTAMFGMLLTATALCIAFESGQSQSSEDVLA